MNFNKFKLLIESAEKSLRTEVEMPKDPGNKFNEYMDFSQLITNFIFELKKLDDILSDEEVDEKELKEQCRIIADNELNQFINSIKNVLGNQSIKAEDNKNPTPQEVKAGAKRHVEKKNISKNFSNLENKINIALRKWDLTNSNGDKPEAIEVKKYFNGPRTSKEYAKLSKTAKIVVRYIQ